MYKNMSVILNKNASAYKAHNRVTLLRGGKLYFDQLVKMIEDAKETVHLQVYIFEGDETGKLVADALKGAAARGVQVFMLVDGYASQGLSDEFIEALKNAGIHFRFFEPLLKSRNFYFGRRLHHKVVVADTRFCMVGGLNISNRYNDMPSENAWMDWGIFVEGEVATDLFHICKELWLKSARAYKQAPTGVEPVHPLISEECLVRVRRNDWVRKQNQISESYSEMFSRASDQIIIMSSYFLPGRAMRKKIAAASKRGVNIKLILAGNSDVMIVKYAERYIYHWIFKNKVRVFEYQRNVLHGKLSLYDDKWVTVGSYNVNFISAYASIELNLDVANEPFAKTVKKTIDSIIKEDCMEVSGNDFKTRYNIFHKIIHRISYEFIQLVFFLFTFYFRPRKESSSPESFNNP